MKESDISKALGQHLLTLTDVPYIVFENKDKPNSVARPYLIVQMVRVSRRSLGLNGGGTVARGYMQVTVVHDLDEWAAPAETLSDNIATHFPKALKLTGVGGIVTIMDEPNILPALRDGSDWRVPIQIDYITS